MMAPKPSAAPSCPLERILVMLNHLSIGPSWDAL
jgi:hypothetical protein